MNATEWFPTLIWDDEITSISNSRLKQFALNLRETSTTSKRSNYGGWQSDCSVIFDPLFNPLVDELGKRVQKIVDQINISQEYEVYLDNGWLNINDKYNSNNSHAHPFSFLSCAYYINVPEDNTSVIKFEDPRIQRELCEPEAIYHTPNKFTFFGCDYAPSNGKVLFFPSWIRHSVTESLSDEPRISLAVNYGIRKRK